MRTPAFILAFSLSTSARAADYLVCPVIPTSCSAAPVACTHTSLSAAVLAASAGDVISILPGTYGGTHLIDRDVEVVGIECPAEGLYGRPHFTDMNSVDVVAGATVTLRHLQLSGIYQCMRVRDGSNATMFDMVWTGCGDWLGWTPPPAGASLRIEAGGVVSIQDSSFNDALGAGSAGSAIRMSGASLELIDTDFLRNSGGDGGAVLLEAGTTTITGGLFDSNSGGSGGAIRVSAGAAATVDGATFSNNAAFDGGAIFADANLIVSNSNFSDNSAYFGGHISTTDSAYERTLTVSESTFSGGLAYEDYTFWGGISGGYGGALFLGTEWNGDLDGVTFTGNRANYYGGAIYASSNNTSRTLDIDDCGFVENNSIWSIGGGIFSNHLTVHIYDSLFESNDAASSGGGLFLGGNTSSVDLVRNLFCTNNASSDGGAIWAENLGSTSPRKLTNNVFMENTAGGEGGGLWIQNSTIDIRNNNFLGNYASGSEGGGARLIDNTGQFINNLVVSNNNAGIRMAFHSGTINYNGYYDNGSQDLSTNDGNSWNTNFGLQSVNGSDPVFQTYTRDGDCENDTLTLQASSPMLGAGDPAYPNPGSSASDIGAYGGPDAPDSPNTDLDGDGYAPADGDCDETNPYINPYATELVNDGVDQDCDGLELCPTDGDGDGYGVPSTQTSPALNCIGTGVARTADDCDDSNASIYPAAPEVVADGTDQDCDGLELCFVDSDGDGYGDPYTTLSTSDFSCSTGGAVTDGSDCNDADIAVNPGASEVALDGIDQDCDGGELCAVDADTDAYGSPVDTIASPDMSCTEAGEADNVLDCNDSDSQINPDGIEVVGDAIDQNCDGFEDCYDDNDLDGDGVATVHTSSSTDCTGTGDATTPTDCNDADPNTYTGAPEIPANGNDESCDGLEECFLDVDGDGSAGTQTTTSSDYSCTSGGLFPSADDCNDGRDDIFPGALEIPGDSTDQDCDGIELCYLDADTDGFGTTSPVASPDLECLTSRGHSSVDTDCNDSDPSIFPGAVEITADATDQDCDGTERCYRDDDDDGFGSNATTTADLLCADSFVAPIAGDCDDQSPTVNPGASEITANGVDENCDNFEICFVDGDGDTYGDSSGATVVGSNLQCSDPGQSPTDSDCDDTSSLVYPGAPEIPNDDIDQDCDGTDLNGCFQDLDGDGFGTSTVVIAPTDFYCTQTGNSSYQTDCDDGDNTVYPSAPDVCDAVDSNCDGMGGPGTDEDADGLLWEDEQAITTDGCNPDSDGDTIPDGSEWLDVGSDPLNPDTDGDRVGDGSEVGNPLNPQDHDGDGTWDVFDTDDDGDSVLTSDEDYGAGNPESQDTDGDNTPDYLDTDDDGDTVDTRSEDTDLDGDPRNDDCDGDGVPDYRDDDDDDDTVLTADEESVGANRCSVDSDADLVPDGVEWALGDTNSDGELDILDGDDDGDGISTFEEVLWPDSDVDGDGVDNYRDTNSDGDKRTDAAEGTADDDADGIPNYVDPFDQDGGASDSDGDGINTRDERDLGTDPFNPDTDLDGVDDGTEIGSISSPLDTDGDMQIDALDTDDDGDGLDTRMELGDECGDGSDVTVWFSNGNPVLLRFTCGDGSLLYVRDYRDTDGDGAPDYLDLDDDADGTPTPSEDRNGNGDWLDDDMDADGEPDWLDPFDHDGPAGDLDLDGLSNEEEEAAGTDPLDADTDGDGVLDGDEGLSDTDGDGLVDALDVDDDGDGILSEDEGLQDIDGDGVPNHLDEDSDGDGLTDLQEGTSDTDCDGIPEWADSVADDLCGERDSWRPDTIEWDGCQGCASSGGSPFWWAWVGLLCVRRR